MTGDPNKFTSTPITWSCYYAQLEGIATTVYYSAHRYTACCVVTVSRVVSHQRLVVNNPFGPSSQRNGDAQSSWWTAEATQGLYQMRPSRPGGGRDAKLVRRVPDL